MVDEMRAVRAELDHRRHFTEDKKPIELVRDQLTGWTELKPAQDPAVTVARSAAALHTAAGDDLFEVG
jgi:hypothetical protein